MIKYVGHKHAMDKIEMKNLCSDLQPKASLSRLGIEPASFLDDVFNVVNEYLADAVDALESVLLEKFAPSTADEKERTTKAVDAIYDVLTEALDKYWLKFEDYTQRNLFQIPEGLYIPSEEDGFRADAIGRGVSESEGKLDHQLDILRQTLAQEQAEVASLRRELRAVEMDVQRFHRPVLALNALMQDIAGSKGPWERLQNLMERAAVLRSSHNHQGEGSGQGENVAAALKKWQLLGQEGVQRHQKEIVKEMPEAVFESTGHDKLDGPQS